MNDILLKYQKLEAKLKYEEAQELLSLISDDELYELFIKYPEVFQNVSAIKIETAYKNIKDIEDAINIFINHINSRNLTREEYDAMTKDDILDYFGNLFKETNADILDTINGLENLINKRKHDSRDSEN